jgi:hypothetical protein
MNDTMRFFAATLAAGVLAGCATAPQSAGPGHGPARTAEDSTCLKDTGPRRQLGVLGNRQVLFQRRDAAYGRYHDRWRIAAAGSFHHG